MIKRLLDIIFSLLGLAVLLPLGLLLALLIKLDSRGPVFFKQKRVGLHERPFGMFKFRSMVVNNHAPETLGPIKDQHALVTRVGYLLRRFKLDELPQLINVLRGEMSIVGPRPCLFSRIDTMTKEERRRFHMRPGLSGWAEVNGNLELTWHEQLLLDLWYVDNYSLRLDMLIIVKTVITVIIGSIKNEAALQKANNGKEKI